MISRYIRLLGLSPEVQRLVDWGTSGSTIGFTAASELARLTNPTEQVQVCEAALQNRLKSSDVKQIVQLRLRSMPLVECIENVLRQKPQIQRVNVFVGAVTSTEVASRLRGLTQEQRDDVLVEVLKERFPDLMNVTGRLGTQRFTVTGSDAAAKVLRAGPVDFETAINAALLRKLLS
jgi:hypothetical protein